MAGSELLGNGGKILLNNVDVRAYSQKNYGNCVISSSFSRFLLMIFIMMVTVPWSRAWGCDICAVYNSILSSRGTQNSLNAGVAQQFTSLSSAVGGERQYLESSVTQPFLNYYFTNELSFQVNFPLIYRNTRRLVDTGIEYKEVSGVGDIPLLLKYQAVTKFDSGSSVIWEVFGGVKLPTGSTEQLREESDHDSNENSVNGVIVSEGLDDGGIGSPEIDADSGSNAHSDEHSHSHSHSHDSSVHKSGERTMRHFPRHGGDFDGGLVGGHDLSIGSGSLDWMGGTSLFAVSGRNYFNGLLQYSIRQEGDYGFRYGDDLQWHVGPGRYLVFDDERTVGFRVRLSGEWKRDDVLAGTRLDGSNLYHVFAGPEVMGTFGNRTFLSLGSDFLISSDSAREGVLPHTRFSMVLSHRF
jgi:hypothetical protein